MNLTDKQKALVEKVVKIAKKISIKNREIDKGLEFPWDIFSIFRDEKILSLPIPKVFGGEGVGSLDCCLVIEEIGRHSPSSAHMLAGHWLGFTPLELFCNTMQKDRYFPRLIRELAAFSLTEPSAGSDASGIITEAKKAKSLYS